MLQESYANVVDKIVSICSEIDGYTFVYGAEEMPAVLSDRTKLPCIYLEEYNSGIYNMGSYNNILPYRTTVMNLYFIYIIETSDFRPGMFAYERNKIRSVLEETGVLVFIDKFNTYSVSGSFKGTSEWKYTVDEPMFDVENMVSIKLQVNVTQNYCG